jgi:hypothetical protein
MDATDCLMGVLLQMYHIQVQALLVAAPAAACAPPAAARRYQHRHYKQQVQVGSGTHAPGRPQGTRADKGEGSGGADGTY